MNIAFIGTSTCIPDVGSEVASFIIDGKHLVDTGWCSALAMREHGFDPLAIESVILTHLHQDHYIGLPHLLFFAGLRQRGGTGARPLRIIGPRDHLEKVVDAAATFLQISRFPEIAADYALVPLTAGQSFDLGDLHFSTCAAKHVSGSGNPQQALAYRVTHTATGDGFAFTGDFIGVTYVWQNEGVAAAPADYQVFAHVEPTKSCAKILASDHHNPEIPTSQWKPGLRPVH